MDLEKLRIRTRRAAKSFYWRHREKIRSARNTEEGRAKQRLIYRNRVGPKKSRTAKAKAPKIFQKPSAAAIARRDRWNAANKPKLAAWARQWRSRNKDKVSKWNKRWKINNPSKVKVNRVRRKALIRNATFGNELGVAAFISKLHKRKSFLCYYCKERFPVCRLHVDHVVALANGGHHSIENLCSSCDSCNLKKNAKPISEIQFLNQPLLSL